MILACLVDDCCICELWHHYSEMHIGVEYLAWNSLISRGDMSVDSHPLARFYEGEDGMDLFLEAHCHALFARVMDHLEPLYDPKNGPAGVPAIVAFCSKIQEHYLRQYDAELCDLLEERCIQSHLYGMKWTRLLFGREFALCHSQGMRVWDFIFAYCLETSGANLQPSDVLSEISNVNTSKEALLSKSRYGPHSLLLAGVSDIMISMVLAVSHQHQYASPVPKPNAMILGCLSCLVSLTVVDPGRADRR